MKSFSLTSLLSILVIIISLTIKSEARPGLGALPYYHGLGLHHHYHLPSSASQQTTVVRDALGNQGTAYAYQSHNGVSASAVAVSRSDNSKTLAYLPAIAPALGYAHQHHHHYTPAVIPHPAAAYSGYNNYVGVV